MRIDRESNKTYRDDSQEHQIGPTTGITSRFLTPRSIKCITSASLLPSLTLLACCTILIAIIANAGFCLGQTTPEPDDWFAGDPHVHRGIGCGRSSEKEMLSPAQLMEMMRANNLAVVSVLADAGNGEIKYAAQDLPLITGHDDTLSTSRRIIHWDAEWHYDPAGVTFERQVIGGHLVLLGLRKGGHPYAEYTHPIFSWAKEQGGIGGFAHMQYLPYGLYPPPDGIPLSLDCCAPLEYPVETALGDSSFLMEDVRGGDSALQAYYRLLNTGFRPGLAAGTDYPCNDNEPLGTLLTYVRIPGGKLTYEKWIDGLARGRTVVSRRAHKEFLNLSVNDAAQPGDEVRLGEKGAVRVRIEWQSVDENVGRIELVKDGSVMASKVGSAVPGAPLVFETSVEFRRSGWLAARRMDWQNGHQTHTGAVFVIVNDDPIRASAEDAAFYIRWIDNLLEQTSSTGSWQHFFTDDREAAQKRYRDARAIFVRIKAEAEKQQAP